MLLTLLINWAIKPFTMYAIAFAFLGILFRGFIGADAVAEGAVVVDVGINRIDAPERKSGTRLVGDVDMEGLKGHASALTPVPGGVGPMTIAMLMANTLRAAEIALANN